MEEWQWNDGAQWHTCGAVRCGVLSRPPDVSETNHVVYTMSDRVIKGIWDIDRKLIASA